MGSIWTSVVIAGPIILAIAIIWAALHNRSSRREREAGDRATRALYDRDDRSAHHANGR